jgi:hypothetical protein
VALISGALLVHGALPRYEWHASNPRDGVARYIQFDRWTGAGAIRPYALPPEPITLDQIASIEPPSRRYIEIVEGWPTLDLLALALWLALGGLVVYFGRRRIFRLIRAKTAR